MLRDLRRSRGDVDRTGFARRDLVVGKAAAVIADVDVGVVRADHEIEQAMTALLPTLACRCDVEGHHAMGDVADVEHGDEALAREHVLEHQCFVLAVQRRACGGDHPLDAGLEAVLVIGLEQGDLRNVADTSF